jgi:NAD-dependent DNA ligase
MADIDLSQFETIGDKYSKILKDKMKIDTVDDFYEHSLEEIVEKTEIESKRVQQFIDVLDLFRIPKLSIRNAELLYSANINSVEELSHRQASRIYYKLKQIDVESHLIILQLPSFAEISEWIYYSKLLSKRIKYGLNIPMILLPIIGLDEATELKKFQIITVEDFRNRSRLVPGLRKKLGLSKDEFKDLNNIVKMLEIDGIDAYMAACLMEIGIKTIEDLNNTPLSEIMNKLNGIMGKVHCFEECMEENEIAFAKSNAEKGGR